MSIKGTYRFVFAGGGTGGHLYPAIAVAQQLKLLKPEADILFVGTKNKIEGKVVPKTGFQFKSIWISGFSRKLNLKNILFPLKLFISLIQSLMINVSFKPKVVIGTGSYVAGPVVWTASVLGRKVILLEQNSYPGVTNRMLEKRADEIHLSFEESKKYFRNKEKLMFTGNPIRISLEKKDKLQALKEYNFSPEYKTIFVTGGSLGAKSINESIAENLTELANRKIQVIWQTGSLYYDQYKSLESEKVKVMDFVEDMSAAYSASDMVIARAGATTIAEVSFLGLPVLFIPSPNVAANHQYKNALALKEKNAGELLENKDLRVKLLSVIDSLIMDEGKLKTFSENIKQFSKPDAASIVAENALKLAEME